MKQKFIRKSIRAKLEKWLESIEDPKIRKLAKDEAIVTGGCIVSMFLGEKVNDYDVYFRSRKTAKIIGQYYIDQFWKVYPDKDNSRCPKPKFEEIKERGYDRIHIKSAGILTMSTEAMYNYFETMNNDVEKDNAIDAFLSIMDNASEELGKYFPVCLSPNAVTLTDKIQIITRFHGSVEEIHENFDFVHVKGSYDFKKDVLTIPDETAMAMLTKELFFTGSEYPLASLFRIRKFIKRGWSISAGEILKIALRLQEFNLLDMDVLYDQLIGVDAAYFNELMDSLKSAKEKGTTIDRTYIYQVVDKIF
jgi:hypothetical protein